MSLAAKEATSDVAAHDQAPSGESLQKRAPKRDSAVRRLVFGEFSGIWVATIILFAVSPLLASGTLGSSALLGMLPFASVLAIAAIGQTFVVMQGGLDLSVPGMISVGALVASRYGSEHGLLAALVAVLVVSVIVGLINAAAVTRFSIAPFVATLATNALLTGFVLSYSGGSPSTSPDSLNTFALDKTLGVPHTAIIALLLAIAVTIVLKRTVLGRRFKLVGSNEHAARVAGMPVKRYQAGAYVASATCAAIAGVLLAGFLKTPSLQIGDEYLLASIAAVVLGGTSLAGGRGSAAATVVGALFLSQLNQITQAMGAASATQFLVQGSIIGIGMSLRSIPWARMRRHISRKPTAAHDRDRSAGATHHGGM